MIRRLYGCNKKHRPFFERVDVLLSAISGVDKVQLLPRDIREAVDQRNVRRASVGHSEPREETRYVQRDIVSRYGTAAVLQPGYPAGYRPHLVLAVVMTGYDKRRELDMAVLHRTFYEIRDLLSVSVQHIIVIPVGEAFQVDVHSVGVRQQLFKHTELRGAVRHKHVHKPRLMHELRGIAHELVADKRLVVGESEPDVPLAAQSYRRGGELPGSYCLCGLRRRESLLRPRNAAVLAERAAKIAAVAAHREDHAPRVKTVQRLFLYRVEGK